MKFALKSSYKTSPGQRQAIDEIVSGFSQFQKETLLGITGSGKTFVMANVIQKLQKPTLIIAHNKTLAAQLYTELSELFPDNRVEYFVSYYDYYQPESYLPATDTYIEKDSSINEQIEKGIIESEALLSTAADRPTDDAHVLDLLESANAPNAQTYKSSPSKSSKGSGKAGHAKVTKPSKKATSAKTGKKSKKR